MEERDFKEIWNELEINQKTNESRANGNILKNNTQKIKLWNEYYITVLQIFARKINSEQSGSIGYLSVRSEATVPESLTL
jgi:hypothetical protein